MMRFYTVVFLLLLRFLLLESNFAQKPELKFERLETNVNFDLVRSIWRDSYGYLWIGNDGIGLAKNDGYATIKYMHDEKIKGSLSNDNVLAIYEDSKKTLWIGTRGGLNIFHPETETFTNFLHNPDDKNSISNNIINSIYEDDKQNLWFATDDGLNLWIEGENAFKQFNIQGNGQFSNNITSITQNAKGNFWLATRGDGIFSFDPSTGNHSFFNDSLIDFGKGTVKKLFIDKQDKIWIGTFGSGLITFDIKTQHFTQFNTIGDGRGTNGKLIYDIIPENEKYLIIGIDQGGINIMDKEKGTFEYIMSDEKSEFGLTNNGIYSFHKDVEGILWIGTSRGGVLYSNSKKHKFKLFRHNSNNPNSLSNNIVGYLFEDSDGYIWIATDGGGLDRYNKKDGTFKHYVHDPDDPHSISTNVVRCVTEDEDNNLWVGTWDFGMNKLNKRTEKFYSYMPNPNDDKSISSRVVWNIYRDENNLLWLATFLGGGIDVFDTRIGVIRYYNEANAEPGEVNPWKVYLITADNNKDIWACAKNGLFKYNKKTASFELHKHFENTSCGAFEQDIDGNIWVGTAKKGIQVLKPDGTFIKSYTTKDDLADNHICAIMRDSKGNMWISTHHGISQFMNATGTFRNYSEEDGLQGNKFFDQSYLKTRDGEMYFGGTKGFSTFHPDSLKENDYIPPVYINDFLLFNKPVEIDGADSILHKHISVTEEITLTWEQSVLTFGFSAISFTFPYKNTYAYKMENFESDWNYTKADRRYASYTNLPPDKYVFRVKASNNDGVWNEEGTSLKITILPPWWQTWWFRTFALLFIVVSALSFYYYRVNALKRQKMILEQKVTERTSELREANAQLEEKQEEIMQQNEEIIAVNNQLKTKNEEIESQKEEIETSRDQLERAFNNISLLSDFGQKLTATFDFDAINAMIFDYVSSLMDTSAFGIGIYNEQRKTIDFPYFMENGEPVPYFSKLLSNESSLSVKCFKNAEEIIMNDLSQEYIKYLKTLPEIQTAQLPASVIHLPLNIKNKAIGVLTVNSYKKNAFDQTDLTNLRTLGSYISIALDNSMAYRVVSRQKEQITGSIVYGQTIQRAMLPSSDILENYFQNFILFRPKDIVSGDFYWFSVLEKQMIAPQRKGIESNPEQDPKDSKTLSLQNKKPVIFFAVVDCTGHGVPGAFMSMIGSRLLNEIVNEKHIIDPKLILEQLDNNIKTALRQEETHNNDGMDLGIVRIEEVDNAYNITYASAKQNLFIWKNNEEKLDTIEGTRRSIGGFRMRKRIFDFKNNSITLHKGDVLYLSSDGLPDQCDPQRVKFSTKRLKEILKEMGPNDMKTQLDILTEKLDSFQKGYHQRDDITLVGLKL